MSWAVKRNFLGEKAGEIWEATRARANEAVSQSVLVTQPLGDPIQGMLSNRRSLIFLQDDGSSRRYASLASISTAAINAGSLPLLTHA
jgi:hypothetical protein